MRISSLSAAVLAALLSSTGVAQETAKDAASPPASPDAIHGGPHAMHAPMQHDDMKSSPGAARAPFDQQFLDTMAAHHQAAIDMARLAEQRAGHDELKKMAKKMAEDQEREVRQLQEWKQQWYAGKDDALNMKMPGMMASMKNMRMDKLEAAEGKRFDALFIDMMRRHHKGAIKMARAAERKAVHPELKIMAGKIIEEQEKEIAQMTQWKKDWKLAAG